MLDFDKVLTCIEKIRERFGKSMYLWIYANGGLVNKNKLIKLKKSGLDEIRFKNMEKFRSRLFRDILIILFLSKILIKNSILKNK